jgi:hypothetical protein
MNRSPFRTQEKEKAMRWIWLLVWMGLVSLAVLMTVSLTRGSLDEVATWTQEPKPATPSVVLANTYNAVTRVHFTNVSVHKGSHNPNLAERRFQADVRYWLMDARYYNHGELSIGNPELVEFVRQLGSKNLPDSKPTTLSAMAYGIARAVLEKYSIIQRVEIRLTHFAKGLEAKDESEDNHVVKIVLQR